MLRITPNYLTRNVRDEFSNNNASGNNGSQNWVGNWIRSGGTTFTSNQLRIRTSNASASRRVNLSGASAATLTINYSGVGTNPNISVELASGDDQSGTFYQIITINTSQSQQVAIDISNFISSNTTLRIRALSGGD